MYKNVVPVWYQYEPPWQRVWPEAEMYTAPGHARAYDRCQMSSSYCAMVRSEENVPAMATFTSAFWIQA